MDNKKAAQFVNRRWDESILDELVAYVRIPNKSPMFDPDWEAHGHMEAAVQLMRRWAEHEAGSLPGARVEVLRLPGRTPVLMVDVPGTVDDCVLMYGHLDKQPEFTGWADGLGPWTPVLRDGKLYGRGGADDGYALFASLTAIRALREQGVPHARCVILIEASEESGSPDLSHHIDALGARLGHPSLVVCLVAECGNYEQLWCTASLRGNLIGSLRVDVLSKGVHSGTASGIVPSSFRVLRELLARVEDAGSGAILVEELHPVFCLVGAGCWVLAGRLSPDPEVAWQFAIYGSVLVGGSAFTLFWSVLPDSVVKAHADTRSTMWAGIWSNVVNVVLNTIFTFVFGWGIFGIALSTVIGRFAGLAYALRKAAEHEARRKGREGPRDLALDPHPYRASFALAVPAAVAYTLMAAESAIVNGMLLRLDAAREAVAAYAIYYRAFQFSVMPAVAEMEE